MIATAAGEEKEDPTLIQGENMWTIGQGRVELDAQAVELCARKVAAVSGDARKLMALSNRAAGRSGMPSRARRTPIQEETEMPKMKTKSSVKKRFKVTASGRIKVAQAGKRHGMIKRTNKFIRNARGTTLLSKADEQIILPMMPYAKK